MDDKKTTFSDSRQTRAYAAYYGLWVGLCWAASFALSMYALTHPSVGSLGLILGPCVYIVGKKVYRTMHPELAGRGTTGYFDRGFGQKAEPGRKEPEGVVIDITDDVEEVREEAQ